MLVVTSEQVMYLQTSEQEMLRKEHGGQENKDASDEILYKIDIPANRYDMLCLEGIARALNIFNRTAKVPQYKVADMSGTTNMTHLTCWPHVGTA